MLTRRVTLLQQCSRLRNIYSQKSTKAKVDTSELAFPEKNRLPIPIPKIAKREPFIKGLFVGKYDEDMLTYPEPQSDVRHREFQEWLKPIKEYVNTVDAGKIYESPSFPVEVREKLKELGIYEGRIPHEYDGMELLNSEYLQLIETLSVVPKLGLNFLQCNSFPVELLKAEGSVEQKFEYLKKISSGQCVPVVCFNEEESRTDIDKIQTLAHLSRDEKTWIIHGKKTFVQQDNNANTFLVFALAKIGGDKRRLQENLSVFIVDKNTPGVGELVSVESPWLGGENMFSVNFKEVSIPYGNLIGEIGKGLEFSEKFFTADAYLWAGVYISILKNFLNSIINYVIPNTMHERESIRNVITKMTVSIYAMESMAYLTSSLSDVHDGQDLTVENVVVKDFCSRECIARFNDAFQLLGAHLCAKTFPFEQVMRNQMFGLHGNSDLRTFAGLLGMKHAGTHCADFVKQFRNPFEYPHFMFRKMLGLEEVFPRLHLEENLHPTFRNHIAFLEQSIGRLSKSTLTIFNRFAVEVLTHENDAQRLSEMASLIYGVTAVFGRASRSYCIGLANSDYEIPVAAIFAFNAFMRVRNLHKEIELGDHLNGNTVQKDICDKMYGLKKYYMEHPLERNW